MMQYVKAHFYLLPNGKKDKKEILKSYKEFAYGRSANLQRLDISSLKSLMLDSGGYGYIISDEKPAGALYASRVTRYIEKKIRR